MSLPCSRAVRSISGLAAMFACLGLCGLIAGAGRAAAQPSPHLALSPLSGPPGTPVSLRGSGFRPYARGVVLFGGHRVASFRASGRGRLLVSFVVPAGASGRIRLLVERLARGRRGSLHRLRWARARFQVTGGGSGGSGGSGATPGLARPDGPGGGGAGGSPAAHWTPPQHLTWYWQLQGAINNDEPVAAYDIDGFENSAGEVSALHSQGKHVICYVDVGTYEPDRPDSSVFPSSVLGSGVEGWPGERWLDVRQLASLEPIMAARFQMCRAKGFDAVEPDNMDGYENKSGFPITAAQQLAYDGWVAGEVHSLGMAVFQKNDGEQTGALEPYFDGALDEQCNQYSECANFSAYLTAGKPVLNAEYSLSTSSFCSADNAAGIMGARFSLELDGSTFEPCW
jgi:hypothetical protein